MDPKTNPNNIELTKQTNGLEVEKTIDLPTSSKTEVRGRPRARSNSPKRFFSRERSMSPVARRIMPPIALAAIRHETDNKKPHPTFPSYPSAVRNLGKNKNDNDSTSSDDHIASILSPNKLTILQKDCYSRAISRDKSIQDSTEVRQTRSSKDFRDIRENNESKDSNEGKDTKVSKDNKDSKDVKDENIKQKKKEKYTKDEIEKQRKNVEEKIYDIQNMLAIELKMINKKSEDPKKERRREKIEKLFRDAKLGSELDYDMDTWLEIEDYWEELRAEQYERLKENVALTDDVIIDNDFLIVDSNETYKNIVQITDDEMLSISLDIVAIYLKGQKILYTEAKTFCEQQLNFLMMPAIFISALTTVLSMALDKTKFGSVLIASLTAVNSFLLAIISYLKLDAKSEAHKTSAYQFDKLQSKCEFGSGRVIFFSKTKYLKGPDANQNEQYKAVFDLIDEIELKVTEIKDMNKFILPERVRRSLANLYGVNVFSAVKSFLTSEKYLKAELNRCIEIQRKYNDEIQRVGASIEERQNNRDLIYTWNVNMRMKRDIERKLIEERENYMKLDRSMLNDISSKHVNQMDCCCCNCCGWLKT